jgi:type 1 glutamine amidotransferase/nicotinamidase-related amidase
MAIFKIDLHRALLMGLAALIALCSTSIVILAEETVPAENSIRIQQRWREAIPDSDEYDIEYERTDWDAKKTAVIVCDMWDQHWCLSATSRCEELAPRMNELIGAFRDRGALIVHAPSGTLDAYEGTPGRELVEQAVEEAGEVPDVGWASLDEEVEGALPIDDSDEGCCDNPPCEPYQAWKGQTELMVIEPSDAITDSAEIYALFEQRGIENVVLMGVHVNMCVLGRPFGIRRLVERDMNVVLVRDMTDSMYNPAKSPRVPHVRGTELVIEHIEKHWCPTISSSDLLGGPAFRFDEDERPHVAFLVSDDHYLADETLPQFAQELREEHGYYCTVMHGEGTNDIQATGELEAADVLVLFIRRLALPEDQLQAVRDYLDSGRPIVALRTASHAFDTKGIVPEGCANWTTFDPDVLGGSYAGHGSNDLGSDIAIVSNRRTHPILRGVTPSTWHSTGSLYNVLPINEDADILMYGSTSEAQNEAITWTRKFGESPVAVTMLGHPDDFTQPQFRTMLRNMIRWSLDESE